MSLRYCEDIEVYDLQKCGYWLFDVNEWFDVMGDEPIVDIQFHPCESVADEMSEIEVKYESRMSMLKTLLNMDEPVHTWNIMYFYQRTFLNNFLIV